MYRLEDVLHRAAKVVLPRGLVRLDDLTISYLLAVDPPLSSLHWRDTEEMYVLFQPAVGRTEKGRTSLHTDGFQSLCIDATKIMDPTERGPYDEDHRRIKLLGCP